MGEVQYYDHVVAGSGISGMSAAVLLARQGGRVLVLEKAPSIGGSMARFSLEGVPFDIGFHFSGGLAPKGLLSDMLTVLGIKDKIRAVPFSNDCGSQFVIESSGNSYMFPCERAGLIRELHARFPAERTAIETYFAKIDSVCARTPSMNLRHLGDSMGPLDEDYQSLRDVLDGLTCNEELRAILSGFCLCYGVAPSEVSFANHARMCQGMLDNLMHIEQGGSAFVSALKTALDEAGVEVRCNSHIAACEEISKGNAGAFRLNSGELIRFSNGILSLHPQSILEILPREILRKAFINRITDFESSIGFFAVFGVCDDLDLLDDCMINFFPQCDFDVLLKPGNRRSDSMLFCITKQETVDGRRYRTLTALEACHPEDMKEWADSSLMNRSSTYADYKVKKTERIVERIEAYLPQLRGRISVLGSSSPLTFRDYLHSPDGSAYGVKQKMGQFNLLGRLPLHNLHAIGQSSLLPGVMGSMVSSFIVCRSILDRSEFDQDIQRRLQS